MMFCHPLLLQPDLMLKHRVIALLYHTWWGYLRVVSSLIRIFQYILSLRGSTSAAATRHHLMRYTVPSISNRLFISNWNCPYGVICCLLYTSDAADDLLCVDLGGRRILKKKKNKQAPIHPSMTLWRDKTNSTIDNS